MTNVALQSLQKLLLCQSLFYDIQMHCITDVDSLLRNGSSAESRRSSLSQTRGEEFFILTTVILSCRSTLFDLLGRFSRPQLTLCKGSSRSVKVDCPHCNTCELKVTRTTRCVYLSTLTSPSTSSSTWRSFAVVCVYQACYPMKLQHPSSVCRPHRIQDAVGPNPHRYFGCGDLPPSMAHVTQGPRDSGLGSPRRMDSTKEPKRANWIVTCPLRSFFSSARRNSVVSARWTGGGEVESTALLHWCHECDYGHVA